MQTLTYRSELAKINAALAFNPALNCLALADDVDAMVGSWQIEDGLNALFDGLLGARNSMSREEFRALAEYLRSEHPVVEALFGDPMTKRAWEKPRGYAGDAVMMDYLYGIHYAEEAEAQASELGREIYRYIQSRPAGQAVRYRRQHIAGLIDQLAEAKERPSVLAIAAGHLREAELSQALSAGQLGRFVALDADADSMQEVRKHYSGMGVETVHGSVRHILARKVKLGTFDFVYAAGLYDYLNDSIAQALTSRMFDMTNPGGQVLVPNFAPSVKDRAYMETFMAWDLIYRDAKDMEKLVAGIDAAQIESCKVYPDPTNSVVYLLVKKTA
jgi:hypothetical protein